MDYKKLVSYCESKSKIKRRSLTDIKPDKSIKPNSSYIDKDNKSNSSSYINKNKSDFKFQKNQSLSKEHKRPEKDTYVKDSTVDTFNIYSQIFGVSDSKSFKHKKK